MYGLHTLGAEDADSAAQLLRLQAAQKAAASASSPAKAASSADDSGLPVSLKTVGIVTALIAVVGIYLKVTDKK